MEGGQVSPGRLVVRHAAPRFAAALLVLTALGAGAQADQPAAPEPLERYLELLAELGHTLAGSSHDCDALAERLEAWTTTHGTDLEALIAVLEAEPPDLDSDPALRDTVAATLEPALDHLVQATLSCAEHERATAALEALRLAP